MPRERDRDRVRVPWEGSTRRERLPVDWPELRRLAKLRNPDRVCHLCGVVGGDFLDHKVPGDDHRIENLDWAHDRVAPHCHRSKSGREGAQAAARIRRGRFRPPEIHPGLA